VAGPFYKGDRFRDSEVSRRALHGWPPLNRPLSFASHRVSNARTASAGPTLACLAVGVTFWNAKCMSCSLNPLQGGAWGRRESTMKEGRPQA
jgi:hypothetical protein